jgi:hypothetical protein
MSIEGDRFRESVTRVILEKKPKAIIETGTYLGAGSTMVAAKALAGLKREYRMYTIEANPAFAAVAERNLREFSSVVVLRGMSLPKAMLPDEEKLRSWLELMANEDVYVDFEEHERVQCYLQECRWNVPDDMLRICMKVFGYRADMFILDSAGHLGWEEFNHIISLQEGPCVFVLDDTLHVKHFRSLRTIKSDRRFAVIEESEEKFGFCIAEYNPEG